MFYWFFPYSPDSNSTISASEEFMDISESKESTLEKQKPLVIWLTGGPGCSSELSIFFENGPFRLKNGEKQLNPYSWNKEANMLYVDFPLGEGFSITDSTFDG